MQREVELSRFIPDFFVRFYTMLFTTQPMIPTVQASGALLMVLLKSHALQSNMEIFTTAIMELGSTCEVEQVQHLA
jgi:hypothetical protein